MHVSHEVKPGYNTHVTIAGGYVHKTSRYSFPQEQAARLARQVEEYALAFESEPIKCPEVTSIALTPLPNNRFQIEHITRLCEGPNIQDVPENQRQTTLQSILAQLATMSVINNQGDLRVPLDSAANNLHTEDGQGVMIDLFPPLLRDATGRFPVENIQHMQSRIRRNYARYAKGTREGAVLTTLFTALTGDHPLTQAPIIAKGIDDWCFDVVPGSLPATEKDTIHKQLQQRFIPYFLRSSINGGIAEFRRRVKLAPYPSKPFDNHPSL